MKKIFTLTMLVVLSSMVMFAQGSKQKNPFKPFTGVATQNVLSSKAIAKSPTAQRSARVKRQDPPADASTETWYTSGGTFYSYGSSGWDDYTSSMSEIQVAISGNTMYIQGLAYWFNEAWVEGTINGSTVTFASGQLFGTDEYGDEYFVGSNDGSTTCDVVFEYDEENGTLIAQTAYIVESSSATSVSPYCYWYNAEFSTVEPEGPEAVVLPEGVEAVEYALTYITSDSQNGSGIAAVAVDGNDVYFQGFSSYIPDAWIKGTKDGNTITFPKQYLGSYSGYDSYLYEECTFTYDPTDESYFSEDHVYSVLGNRYYDLNTYNPQLKKVVEKAAIPANPSITGLTESESYGWYISYNVPNVDTNGDALSASKLYYQFYVDVEHEVSPLTFTVANHNRLEEDLTVIPFGFTENYDFYSDQIYLNDDYSADWNKIGIKSIYEGGGESHETEIQWFTIKEYTTEEEGKTDASWVAGDQGFTNGQAIESFNIDDNLSVALSQGSGSNAPAYYNTGSTLRIYANNTFTISANENVEAIEQIVFTFSSASYTGTLSADESAAPSLFGAGPARAYEVTETTGTWTGSAKTVTFTNTATSQARIVSIDVKYANAATGITDLTDNSEIVSEKYFDLQGRATTANTRGIFLKQIRDAQGNVKTTKVIRK